VLIEGDAGLGKTALGIPGPLGGSFESASNVKTAQELLPAGTPVSLKITIVRVVAPGLYRNERQAFLPYLVATPVFFLLGAMLVYFLVWPMLARFSLGMQQAASAGQAAEAKRAGRTAATSRFMRASPLACLSVRLL